MKIRILFIALILIGIPKIEAQEAQDSLNNVFYNHKMAFGDQNNFGKIRTMRMFGTYSSFGYEYPIVISRMRPNYCHIEIKRGNDRDICSYDGQKTELKRQSKLSEDDIPLYKAVVIAMSNYDLLPFYHSIEKDIQIVGKDKYDGENVYNLQIVMDDGTTENWFINCSTFRLDKVSGICDWYSGRRAKKQVLYQEYKPVDGIYIPHYYFMDITTFYVEIEIEKVEINPELADNLFKSSLR